MKQFNDKNFVLETEVAQDLYHNHAAKCQSLTIIVI